MRLLSLALGIVLVSSCQVPRTATGKRFKAWPVNIDGLITSMESKTGFKTGLYEGTEEYAKSSDHLCNLHIQGDIPLEINEEGVDKTAQVAGEIIKSDLMARGFRPELSKDSSCKVDLRYTYERGSFAGDIAIKSLRVKDGVLLVITYSEEDLGYVPDVDAKTREFQRDEYRKGYAAAKADLRKGILGFEAVNGGEEERWQIVWCYRRILKERYGIGYRVIGHFGLPGPEARAAGYQKVVRPEIEGRLGVDWEERIFEEARVFHRDHWQEVADIYKKEEGRGE